ncbi:GNAT family N-acetyltransferase [Lentzea sp. BCCO 10_0856]|uniref:GNAT family N-acetyltransferase n=1 Tax=Lentzea miocenica TaxID=3095431 RepID=A0ABU4SVD8_9PSEU|nr:MULTISPECIES: GNAT family N-acetyltransferase [unclassified Lentzea]MDX8029723.1 GNAT family N-acetyltransferase [Lentzea sp. BCCO 10_0856]WUD22816.1 GNAT family N-acetyltransferase [Lentzea sp. NBC_00516]
MSRRVVGVTLDNLEHLSKHSRTCVFWELAPHLREQAEEYGDTEFEKEAWVSSVLLEWGSCGRMIYCDGIPAGSVFYAPPAAVPRSAAFPTSPVSPDAVLMTSLDVLPEFRGGGLARVLVQAVAKDLTRRGVKAIEAFGDMRPDDEESSCVTPADFLTSVGFKTVRPHPRWPRLRLELRSAITWKEDVEAALERLLNSVTVSTAEPSFRPV